MGGKALKAKEYLNLALNSHLNNIHDTFQLLDQPPSYSVEKVGWGEVITMAEQLSKQATIAGMLWIQEALDMKELEENMKVYFNVLQGFLLLSHGSTVDAGPTLCSSIHASTKQVVDCSVSLMKEAVSTYGCQNTDHKLSIPQLAGTVWEACNALKKAPTTNYIAIGRAMTHVAVSVKDVLRELKELKPSSPDPGDENPNEADDDSSVQLHTDDDRSSEGDIGNDLSLEEMIIAHSAINVVSDTLVFIKELIRLITSLLKPSKPGNSSSHPVISLEKLLKLCQGIGVQVDEIGACLYPPQEIPTIKVLVENIASEVDELKAEVCGLECSSEGFFQACEGLGNSLRKLQSEVLPSDAINLSSKMQNLVVNQY